VNSVYGFKDDVLSLDDEEGKVIDEASLIQKDHRTLNRLKHEVGEFKDITLLARISTTLEAALNNQETTLPFNPGIDAAALPTKVLRYEATFLRAALTLSTNPLPGEGLGEGVVGWRCNYVSYSSYS